MHVTVPATGKRTFIPAQNPATQAGMPLAQADPYASIRRERARGGVSAGRGYAPAHAPQDPPAYTPDQMVDLISELPMLPENERYLMHRTYREVDVNLGRFGKIRFDNQGLAEVPLSVARFACKTNPDNYVMGPGGCPAEQAPAAPLSVMPLPVSAPSAQPLQRTPVTREEQIARMEASEAALEQRSAPSVTYVESVQINALKERIEDLEEENRMLQEAAGVIGDEEALADLLGDVRGHNPLHEIIAHAMIRPGSVPQDEVHVALLQVFPHLNASLAIAPKAAAKKPATKKKKPAAKKPVAQAATPSK